jgi:hypothetical protein
MTDSPAGSREARMGHAVELLSNHVSAYGVCYEPQEFADPDAVRELMHDHTPSAILAPLKLALMAAAKFLAREFDATLPHGEPDPITTEPVPD